MPKFFGTLAFKKVVQVVQIRGRGGVEVIWTKSKRTATFFQESVPNFSNIRGLYSGQTLLPVQSRQTQETSFAQWNGTR